MQRDQLVEAFFSSSESMQKAWKAQFYKFLDHAEIPAAQVSLLFLIKERQPINGRDLALTMHITRSAVAQLTEALHKLGYVQRRDDKDDRRISYVLLTDKGEAKLGELRQRRIEILTRLAGVLSDGELQSLVSINAKMIKELER
ncbi:MAG: MarR family winged helix-turn-helix transcriptional regulator [Candidatus Saccharimonadales bacterium]